QLSKLILTSQTVDVGSDSAQMSPTKLDFDLSPYELQEELLNAKRRLESQETQILSLEATLSARPLLPPDAPEDEKDKLIAELQRTNRELSLTVQGYEAHLGEPLRAVKEDVEKEWKEKVELLEKELGSNKEWVKEIVKELEREKQARIRLEKEKSALLAFVTDIDIHMRERTPFPSSLPRPSSGIPRASFGNSSKDGSTKRYTTGSIFTESTNAIRPSGGLDGVKEEAEDKENVSPVPAV
ncbi:5351_t:CDS:2, partial [Acaulospora colombiana]